MSALGGRLCRGSTQARRYTQGTLARYGGWLGSTSLKRRSAGILKPYTFWNLVCWTHQPLFPSAVIVNARLPPFSTYLSVRFGSGLSCRCWKKRLLRGSFLLLWIRQLAALTRLPFGGFFAITVAASWPSV